MLVWKLKNTTKAKQTKNLNIHLYFTTFAIVLPFNILFNILYINVNSKLQNFLKKLKIFTLYLINKPCLV